MKWIHRLACFFLIISLFLLANPSFKASAEENSFPYEGTYLTEEDYVIQGFHFNSEGETVTVLINLEGTRLPNRFNDLRNASPNDALTGLIDPTLSQEEILTMREELGLEPIDYAAILTKTAERIEPEMRHADVLKLIDQQVPGIYLYPDRYHVNEIVITKPSIKSSQNLWIVELLGQRLLRFEMGEDLDTLIDDHDINYTRVSASNDTH